ncbi:DUF2271 domain-containing protein [Sphingomonas oleivorans]|uniref:DUF2271 domain-containing protein n=1 Tax=Sphingomonas oleivorans TaxID=1735121 RepID=UPI001A9D1D2E|nr:DUF2271 domain-containing protein [Sphingomonas oleivorans]
MKISHNIVIGGLAAPASALFAFPAMPAGLDLSITIPQIKVAEYHRPYVAVWLEQPDQPTARTLSVWYQTVKKGNEEGTKWLHDVRSWWRKSGRSMRFPADGISGATRAPGPQKLSFTAGKGPLGTLAPGNYELVVEAAREDGGRELVRLPFAWPATPGQTMVRASGKSELGAIALSVKP